jgi:hypothetical protein
MQPVPNFRGNNSAFTTALTCGDERQADLCVDQTAQRGWLVLRALQDRVGEQRGADAEKFSTGCGLSETRPPSSSTNRNTSSAMKLILAASCLDRPTL